MTVYAVGMKDGFNCKLLKKEHIKLYSILM